MEILFTLQKKDSIANYTSIKNKIKQWILEEAQLLWYRINTVSLLENIFKIIINLLRQ